MSELARCTKQRNGQECRESLRFFVLAHGRVIERCPVCDLHEPPRKLATPPEDKPLPEKDHHCEWEPCGKLFTRKSSAPHQKYCSRGCAGQVTRLAHQRRFVGAT